MSFAVALLVAVADPVVVDAGPPPIETPVDAIVDAGTQAPSDLPGSSHSSSPSIPNLALTAVVEPQPVTFGAQFDLVVTITRDRGVHLEIPGAIPESASTPKVGDPVRSVEDLLPASSSVDAGPVAPRVRETIKIPFLALDTQDVKTPAFVLTDKNGATVEVPALDVKVAVEPDQMPNPNGPDAGPAPPNAVVLEPAAPAIAYAVSDARPFVVFGSFALAGALYGAVRFAARRRRALVVALPTKPAPPPRPAHEVALERLEALLASGLLQRGETATFVERLMDEVLRDYIAARFALPAGTRTTRELVKDLLGVAVAGLDVSLVEGLLADADLVKFAKASIAAERAHAMATRVRMLIDATKVVPASGATT
jgi:hypothetical protein